MNVLVWFAVRKRYPLICRAFYEQTVPCNKTGESRFSIPFSVQSNIEIYHTVYDRRHYSRMQIRSTYWSKYSVNYYLLVITDTNYAGLTVLLILRATLGISAISGGYDWHSSYPVRHIGRWLFPYATGRLERSARHILSDVLNVWAIWLKLAFYSTIICCRNV